MPEQDQPDVRPFAGWVDLVGERLGRTLTAADAAQLGAFDGYLGAFSPRAVLVEADYYDRDYLEDYAAYYSRCFQAYQRTTLRFHFFTSTPESVTAALVEAVDGSPGLVKVEQTLSLDYLGFVVVKPLPRAIVGRSCLRPPPDSGGQCVTGRHEAHLYGLALAVESVPFQRQDAVVSRCATTALWCALQQTAQLFGHASPSSIGLTRAGNALSRGRMLPTDGMDDYELSNAIRSTTLDPVIVGLKGAKLDELRRLTFGYIGLGVPIVLGLEIAPFKRKVGTVGGHAGGKHAVTVTGYYTGSRDLVASKAGAESAGEPRLTLGSQAVTGLLIHDDHSTPFARAELADETGSLTLQWPGGETCTARPSLAIIPIYHKIRIGHDEPHEALTALWEPLRASPLSNKLAGAVWDVRLTTGTALKRAASNALPRELRLRSLPRFIWHVSGSGEGGRLLDVLFDATDVRGPSALFAAWAGDPDVAAGLMEFPADLLDDSDAALYLRALLQHFQTRGAAE